jgi:hypothetical protein
VVSIDACAFHDCENLQEIIIPDSVTSIGEEAFYNCKSLTSINLPNNLKVIKKIAFKNCSKLSSITWKGKTYTDKGEFNKAIGVKAWT